MQKLITERNDYATKASTQTARANKAEAAARQTAENLTAAQAQLESMAQESRTVKNERAQLSSRLDEATSKLAVANQELARWKATGATPEQVAALARENRNLSEKLSNLEIERNQLVRANEDLKAKLDLMPPDDESPVLPPVNGKVLVVDPKWNFVVLDIGQKEALRRNGVLMISRDSKLIGKVRISRVEADRSIANVLPGWNLVEIREGDQVFN